MNFNDIKINENNIYRIINGKTYIINTYSKNILYGSANEIWQMLLQGCNYERIIDNISSKYNIDKKTIMKDVDYFLIQLYKKQIIKIGDKVFKKTMNNYKNIQKEEKILNNFYEGMNFLYKVVLEMTYNCNNKCEYCYNGIYKESDLLSINEIKNLIEECKEIGVMHLSFTGGEPFLRRDLLDIIEYAHKSKFYITIQTNGTLINEEIAERLSRYSPISVAVTIHSAYQNIHDSFTKVNGSYKKAINGIKILSEYRIPVTMRCVVTNKNYDGLKEYIKLAKKLNVRYNISPLLYPSIDGSIEPLKLRLNEEQLKEIMLEQYYFPQEDPCGAGKIKVVVSPDGKVYPCPFYHKEIGDLKKESLKTIINSDKALYISKLFSKPEECKKCRLVKNCPRCPVISYYQEGDFKKLNKYDCTISELYYKVRGEFVGDNK